MPLTLTVLPCREDEGGDNQTEVERCAGDSCPALPELRVPHGAPAQPLDENVAAFHTASRLGALRRQASEHTPRVVSRAPKHHYIKLLLVRSLSPGPSRVGSRVTPGSQYDSQPCAQATASLYMKRYGIAAARSLTFPFAKAGTPGLSKSCFIWSCAGKL